MILEKIKYYISSKSSLRLTKAGFIYTGLTIFIGISAVNTGNNFLYFIVSLLLSFMWLSGVFARLNLMGVNLKFDFPKEIYAHRKTFFKITFYKKWGFAFLYRIRITIKNENVKEEIMLRIPFIFKEREFLYPLEFKRRGRCEIERVTIISLFPLALFERKREIICRENVIVFPEPKSCNLTESVIKKERGKGFSRVIGAEEFYSLSDYVIGTPRKLIYWKALAKWEDLKSKVFWEGEKPPLMIDLTKLPLSTLEEKISCATYLILMAYSRGEEVGLILDKERSLPPQRGEIHKIKLLTALALYKEAN